VSILENAITNTSVFASLLVLWVW